MKSQWTSALALAVTVSTLSLGGANIAFGLTSGDEVNIEFEQLIPTAPSQIRNFANGTITLGAAVAGKPGVLHVSTFGVTVVDSGTGIVFNPTNLLFDTNAALLSGSSAGMYVDSGGGAHTLGLMVSGNNWTFTDTKVSTGTKQLSNGTYFAAAVPSVALYDDFSAPLINPDKWFGDEDSGGGGKLAEAVRLIQANKLRLFSRAYGAIDSDVNKGHGSFQLVFPNANSIHAIRAKVQVLNLQSVGCVANPSPTYVAAVIGGFFFNTGTPTPGDSTGDVIAEISVARLSNSTDAPQVLEIFGSVLQCTNADCSTQTSLPGGSVPLGKIAIGVPVRLFIAWDKSKKRFLFQRGINAMAVLPYAVPDNAPPSKAFKRLGLAELVAACTSAPRPAAMVNALFDHVEVGTQ